MENRWNGLSALQSMVGKGASASGASVVGTPFFGSRIQVLSIIQSTACTLLSVRGKRPEVRTMTHTSAPCLETFSLASWVNASSTEIAVDDNIVQGSRTAWTELSRARQGCSCKTCCSGLKEACKANEHFLHNASIRTPIISHLTSAFLLCWGKFFHNSRCA